MIPDSIRDEITAMTGNPHAIEDWMATHLPAAEPLETLTRRAADTHTEWDTLHQFNFVTSDGDTAHLPVIHALDPSIPQTQYPTLLRNLLATGLARRSQDPAAPPVIAVMLELELYTARYSDLTPEDLAVVEREGLQALPNADELYIALVADIAGRVWWATRNRATNEIEAGDLINAHTADTALKLGMFVELAQRLGMMIPLAYAVTSHRTE